METPEIVKALRMCCDAGVEQTPELLCEAADALEKLNCSVMSRYPLDAVELAKVAMALQQLKSENTELVEMLNENKNNPLTVDELRKMDGEPVYLVINDGESTLEMWALVCVDDVNYPKDKPIVLRNSAGGHDLFFNDKELEQEEIHVYSRKPERSEKA